MLTLLLLLLLFVVAAAPNSLPHCGLGLAYVFLLHAAWKLWLIWLVTKK